MNKHKNILIYGLLLMLVFGFIAYIIMALPKKYDNTFECVKYRLGQSDNEYEENISVRFVGTYISNIFGHSFNGNMYINDELFGNMNKDVEDNSNITISFNKYNRALLYKCSDNCDLEIYGAIYINNNFNEFVLCIDENNNWSSNAGLVIAGNATNRQEALDISNRLMVKIIQKQLK